VNGFLRAEPLGPADVPAADAPADSAFPPEERLHPSLLTDLEGFEVLALKDGGTFVGFAVLTVRAPVSYLFFLAVEPGFRSKGYGAAAVDTLRGMHPDCNLSVDFEAPDPGAPNAEQRLRRRKFYLRCGFVPTGLFLRYREGDYEVMSSGRFDEDAFRELLDGLCTIEGFALGYYT